MKLKSVFTFLLCILILSSCHDRYYGLSGTSLISQKFKDEIGDQIGKKYDMQLMGTGGAYDNGITFIGLAFRIARPLNQEQARQILVNAANDLLTAIDTDENLRPILKNFPFLLKDIEIILHCFDPFGQPAYHPDLYFATLIRENLHYVTNEKSQKFKGFKTDIQETFEEAKAILAKQQSEIENIQTTQ
jgi:hypothetical protein